MVPVTVIPRSPNLRMSRLADTRRGRATALAAVAALLLAACTGQAATPGGAQAPSAGSAAAGNRAATLNSAPEPVRVLPDATPVELAVATSAALFASAPVVVVASAADPDGIASAAERAGALGVPLLLAPIPPAASGAGAPSGSASPPAVATPPPATSLTDRLRAEIRRLGAGTVLAVGSGVPDQLGDLGDVRVVTDLAELPDVTGPSTGDPVTVLVYAGGPATTKAAAAAAAATARAAGARVVPVHGSDPRADADAIGMLAGQPVGSVVAAGSGFGPPTRLAGRLAVAATGVQLPGGGQVMFPGRRLVALYGHPGTPSLGVLGEQGEQASIDRAKAVAAPYRPLSDVPVVPTFEIIATVAQGAAGANGDYSYAADPAQLRPLIEASGAAGMYVVLDLQPGRADALSQAKLYESLLRLPYVGLALDPEWKLEPGQLPLQQTGGMDASEINSVIGWLSDLTAAEHLPQKLFVIHQFRLSMIRDEPALDTGRDDVAVLIHMDGQGPTGSKDSTWAAVTAAAPPGVPFGWKNFYDEDHPVLTPAETMTRRPLPVMISYQ